MHGSKQFIGMVENGFVKPYFTSQGGPEVTFCREESLGREVYWLRLQAFRCLISMENSLLSLLDGGHFHFMMESLHVFKVRSVAESWYLPNPLVCAHCVSESKPALPYETSWYYFMSQRRI